MSGQLPDLGLRMQNGRGELYLLRGHIQVFASGASFSFFFFLLGWAI
jgi:hypothetical protein